MTERRACGTGVDHAAAPQHEVFSLIDVKVEALLHIFRAPDTIGPFFGALVEVGSTEQVFTTPVEQRTEDSVTGKFG